MNNRYVPREIEIDLIEVIWRLLAQWKAILIIAIAFAVLMPSVMYIKDNRAYLAALKEKTENVTKLADIDQTIEIILSGLEEADRPAVEQAVINDDIIAAKQDYLFNSLLVNLNTDEAGSLSIGYVFLGVDDVSLQNALINGYISSVGGDKALKTIMKAMGVDSQLRYITELISVSGSADKDMAGVVTVTVTNPDKSNGEAVIDAVNKIMMWTNKSLSKSVTAHRIKRIYVNRASANPDTVAAAKSAAYNDLYNLQNVQRGHTGTFTEDQKIAYDEIKTLKTDAAKTGTSSDKTDAAKRELMPPEISKKYAMVGFILGIILYAVLFFAWLVLRHRIDNAVAAENYIGTRLLGSFFYQKKRKGILSFLLYTKAITKYRYGNEMDLSAQADKISEEINASCENKRIENITLLQLLGDQVAQAFVVAVADKLKIANEIICADPSVDSNALAAKNHVVIFVENDTKVQTLDATLSLCLDYNIEKIGTVFVGRV